MTATPVRWAIIGTGFISNTVAQAIHSSPGSTLSAIGGRTESSVAEFAAAHAVARHTSDVASLIQSNDIDAVYVGTPNHAHHPVVIQAMAAGKATLSEKSLTRTMATAAELAASVEAGQAPFVEGLMYLAHPLYPAVMDQLRSPATGELRSVTGWYHADIHTLANPAGGGTLYNLGCYPVSLLQLVVQTMCGDSAFDERELTAVGTRSQIDGHDVVVDAATSVRFSNGVIASLQSSDTHGMDHGFVVVTTTGTLRWHTNPWLPVAGENVLSWEPHEQEPVRLLVHDEHDAFFHQIQLVERLVASGSLQAERPSPRLSDSLEIMTFLSDWEAAI